MNLQNISEAMADCKQAIILSPQDRAMREHWDLLKTKQAAVQSTQKERDRKSAAKIFQAGTSLYGDVDTTKNNRMPDFDIKHI